MEFDAVFVSHFDADHYKGVTSIIKDPSFRIKRLYHNGIARFARKTADRPPGFDTDLGQTTTSSTGHKILKTTFNTIEDAEDLLATGGLQSTFADFLKAVVDAHTQGRLDSMKRLTDRNDTVPTFGGSTGLKLEVLGPVPGSQAGPFRFRWFGSSSHTRNGHSIVLKLTYGQRTILLGGDLNSEAENHLVSAKGVNAFKVDVAKSCHHGSSDFTVAFMKAIKPWATVISSGDNESYAHPRADALGAAGRYSLGRSPLVFSTELARSIRKSGDILYGMINLRSDGNRMVMAQMKEVRSGADVWDSYEVPFKPNRP